MATASEPGTSCWFSFFPCIHVLARAAQSPRSSCRRSSHSELLEGGEIVFSSSSGVESALCDSGILPELVLTIVHALLSLNVSLEPSRLFLFECILDLF